MEVQEAIGTRRTYRFLLPHKPVELVEARVLGVDKQKALDLPDF